MRKPPETKRWLPPETKRWLPVSFKSESENPQLKFPESSLSILPRGVGTKTNSWGVFRIKPAKKVGCFWPGFADFAGEF